MVAPPKKMMSMGRSSSTSSLSRKMSKFGSALGGGTKKGSSSSSSHHQLLLPKVADAPKDADATRKLQAAINRRAQRRNNRQKATDIKKSTSADADHAPTLYADPSVDALTIPTASFSLSQDSQDTHGTAGSAGSANSASSTDSLNALARENTPLKKKKTAARGRHVGIVTTISADGDEEEKDDCKDMFTPIVPRKKGRPPKRMLPNTINGVQQHSSNPIRDPAEELLERAKARNEAMQRKQMEGERSKKERRDRYQALTQLLDKSETTIKVDNTNVFGGIDAPVNSNRGRNGTPYAPKQPVATAPPPALSYSFSACSEVTYRSPTACEDSEHSGDGISHNGIKRTASHASHRTSSTHVSSAAQPLYESQSLHVNDADDRVRYVRFTDVVTTFHDAEKKNTGARSLGTGGDGQPYESPFVKMHNVKHNYVGGEENRSEFEIELESKMMEHDIEVQRVGCHAQVSAATTSMQLSRNEAAIQLEAQRQAQQKQQRQQQYLQKGSSPTFANPLSPDSLLDGANGAYTLHVDRTCREITYGREAAVGANRGPTISQTTEGFIELEAPEAVHAEYLLRKPTLSFGSAVSDVTASTIRHTNTGEFSSIDGDAEAKEYMYARATANTFKRPPSQASSSNPSIGGAMQQPEPHMSFFGSFADSLTQKLRDCVQPSYDQAVLQSPPPAKMAPPAGIGGRLRDCIAPRREFMVHSPHPGTNKGMMSI